ncbi:hypothetical protein MTR67_007799 [Solanum verrucosum]|uniref:Uncharacterized protein n=1 Tax=Solanum verrucosum TaxID=315347 RepID=A0AAF0Q098_SOLVR|nr:hypothetical protein MTR67_007799 [Solanum verrucosum]
MQILRSCR